MEQKYLIGGIAVVALLGLGGILIARQGTDNNETVTESTTSTVETTTELPTTSTEGATTIETTTTTEAPTTTEPTEPDLKTITVSYDFADDNEGWVAGFADLPEDYDKQDFDLVGEWAALPDGLGEGSLLLAGTNRSADLHMFLTRELDGLVPGQEYSVEWTLALATNVAGDVGGIGGSPTESVFVKAGASQTEPIVSADEQSLLRLSIDVGTQSESGPAAVVLGTLNNPNVEDPDSEAFPLFEIDGRGNGATVSADENGVLWLFTGIDSGFEGRTSVYYAQIEVRLTPTD